MRIVFSALLFVLCTGAGIADELTHAPGSQTLIVDRGRIVYEKNTGVRDLDSKRPVDAHTRFEIGSITKQFTAAAILQLKERGRLALSDPLGKYVTQYGRGNDITIEQLLWQVSGIPDYVDNPAFWNLIKRHGYRAVFTKQLDFAGVLALIKNRPLLFKPGTRWSYSNTNYYLLGQVVERASGMTWEQYVRKNIFRPAGMTDSAFAGDEAHIADMATGYGEARDTHKPIPTGADTSGRGDGGIISTARDLAKWDRALFSGKIVSASDLALMTRGGPKPSGAHEEYGFGWVIDRYDDVQRYQHNGRSIGTVASNQFYPTLSEFLITLANANYVEGTDLANAAFDLRHPALAARQLVPAKGEVPTVTARAKLLWNGIMKGPLDRSIFTKDMNAFMTDRRVAMTKATFARSGDAKAWTFKGTKKLPKATIYAYRVLFANASVMNIEMGLDASGKVSGLLFLP